MLCCPPRSSLLPGSPVSSTDLEPAHRQSRSLRSLSLSLSLSLSASAFAFGRYQRREPPTRRQVGNKGPLQSRRARQPSTFASSLPRRSALSQRCRRCPTPPQISAMRTMVRGKSGVFSRSLLFSHPRRSSALLHPQPKVRGRLRANAKNRRKILLRQRLALAANLACHNRPSRSTRVPAI